MRHALAPFLISGEALMAKHAPLSLGPRPYASTTFDESQAEFADSRRYFTESRGVRYFSMCATGCINDHHDRNRAANSGLRGGCLKALEILDEEQR
jgi:hypothetical protein